VISRTGAGSRTRRRFGAFAVGAAVVALVLTGCASSPAHRAAPEDSYGALPSWLPSDTTQPNSLLVADVHHPAVTSEGDTVEVHLQHASVRMTVVGPQVPGQGLPVQPKDTTCTWTVTVSAATAAVRLRPGDFDTIDHLGARYRVAPVPGQPAIPDHVGPGRSASFELRTAMPTGEGVLRWSAGTGSVLAGWDFVVEND
jgi:hypothetical protein